jgi:predicted aldo/keto reductase-like oxidoreductase
MPTRKLGNTGVEVPIVALGCGSRLLAYPTEEEALAAINLALDLGITYLDTAFGYGNGKSETWVGKVMTTRRAGVFLATKINARKGDDAARILEGSLKRLQTDHVDLIHIHSLADEEDLAAIEAKDGPLEVVRRLREQKVTRFMGITSHTNPAVLRTAIERHDFDCVQMALNAALQGMQNGKGKMVLNPAMKLSFEEVALPAARKKNLGILAMKATGQDDLVGEGTAKADIPTLLRYTLSLPVSAMVVGMPKHEMIRQNAAWARGFTPMPKPEMKRLAARLADANKVALDAKFANHFDC